MIRANIIIAPCLLACLVLAAACGGGGELPEGFPQDFPVYANATVEVATEPPEGGRFLVQWRSSDSPDQVRAFYESELDKVPWQVQNVQDIAEMETTVIAFARMDSGGEQGTVAIAPVQEDGQHVTIALSLSAAQ
ncbi:MAG: hypothetical protein MUP14_05960 [Dehalococcoidia bacterium]|nr:hypothetical protein [Dehalococcoidia bacterium]